MPGGWWFESPERPARADSRSPAVPVVEFTTHDMSVTVVFERSGQLREVRFKGPKLTATRIDTVRVGELVDRARTVLSDLILRYQATRPAGNRKAEAEARRLMETLPGAANDPHLRQEVEAFALWDMVDGFRPTWRPGRAAHSDTLLASRAKDYVERCVEAGEKHGAVARSLGLKPTAFTAQLEAARKRGLLSGRPSRGQVAGRLTAKARKVLEQGTPTEEA